MMQNAFCNKNVVLALHLEKQKLLRQFYHKKTEALWIGSKRGSSEELLPERNFKWPNLKVIALGVWFSVDPEATATLHQEENWKRSGIF